MGKSDSLIFPEITDADIRLVTSLLGLPEHAFYGEDRCDPRQEVLKLKDSIDIVACPGSGKTTLLVAKLAILARNWHYRTRGICVLSHTNAARREIETHLGNTSVGRRLLSYPHFVGTIHGFVDEFLAIPWLRSQGYPIKTIDTRICQEKRWHALPPKIRYGLERRHYSRSILSVKSADFSIGDLKWGKVPLGRGTPTYQKIRETCRNSIKEGYYCYDEMFVWARDLMDNVSGIAEVIRQRFPILFIDEAQDNSEAQSAILHCIFMKGNSQVVRQRFGDSNQAIYNFVGDSEAQTDIFPGAATMDLPSTTTVLYKTAHLTDNGGNTKPPEGR